MVAAACLLPLPLDESSSAERLAGVGPPPPPRPSAAVLLASTATAGGVVVAVVDVGEISPAGWDVVAVPVLIMSPVYAVNIVLLSL